MELMFSLWIYHQAIRKSHAIYSRSPTMRFMLFLLLCNWKNHGKQMIWLFARRLWLWMCAIDFRLYQHHLFDSFFHLSLEHFHISGCQHVLFSITTIWCLWNHVANIRITWIHSMLSSSQRVGHNEHQIHDI